MLDENDSQTQKQLAEQLGVSQQTVHNQLREMEMGKNQKIAKWVPHELNDREMEKSKNTCDIFLVRYNKKEVVFAMCCMG